MKFLWGAATSSHQIEGYNDKNDWWRWEQEGNIEGGVRSGASTDHRNRFPEDLKLAAELGLNSYRFSVEWSRWEPEEGKWDVSAIQWYRDLITECENKGLVPMLTLHHFTSPAWFADKGGFENPDSPKMFMAFVRKVVEELGDRIPLWCTLNEPMVMVGGGYLGKFMPPAKFSPKGASRALRNLLICHVQAYDHIKKHTADPKARFGPWKDQPVEVGIAHNMLDFRADRRWHPIERFVMMLLRRFYNRAWLDAVTGRKQHFGIWPLVPYAAQVPEARGRHTVDFIGVNYYTKGYVTWMPRSSDPHRPAELPLNLTFARRYELASDMEWAVHPRGFAKILRFVAKYGLPVYITENGIADREDRLRPEYIRSHLLVVAHAIREGLDIRGFYYWSLLDNFEWIKGYWPRFGLFQVNYETFERTPTRSAHFYRQIIQAHQENGWTYPEVSYLERVELKLPRPSE